MEKKLTNLKGQANYAYNRIITSVRGDLSAEVKEDTKDINISDLFNKI